MGRREIDPRPEVEVLGSGSPPAPTQRVELHARRPAGRARGAALASGDLGAVWLLTAPADGAGDWTGTPVWLPQDLGLLMPSGRGLHRVRVAEAGLVVEPVERLADVVVEAPYVISP